MKKKIVTHNVGNILNSKKHLRKDFASQMKVDYAQ